MDSRLIESDPSVMMGKPVIAGTRITVELILEKLTKVVGKKKGIKTGNDREEWKHMGYYTNLGSALKGFFRQYTRGGKDWQEVLGRIVEVESMAENYFDLEKRLDLINTRRFRIKTPVNP